LSVKELVECQFDFRNQFAKTNRGRRAFSYKHVLHRGPTRIEYSREVAKVLFERRLHQG